MSEMVERVARIIDRYVWDDMPPQDDPGANWPVMPKDENDRMVRQTIARSRARAIIAAMAEPTDNMILATEPMRRQIHKEIWTAMVREALK